LPVDQASSSITDSLGREKAEILFRLRKKTAWIAVFQVVLNNCGTVLCGGSQYVLFFSLQAF